MFWTTTFGFCLQHVIATVVLFPAVYFGVGALHLGAGALLALCAAILPAAVFYGRASKEEQDLEPPATLLANLTVLIPFTWHGRQAAFFFAPAIVAGVLAALAVLL